MALAGCVDQARGLLEGVVGALTAPPGASVGAPGPAGPPGAPPAPREAAGRNPENDPLVLLQTSLLLAYSFELLRAWPRRALSMSQAIRAFESSAACFDALVLGLRSLIPPEQLPAEVQRQRRKSRAKDAQGETCAARRARLGARGAGGGPPVYARGGAGAHPGLGALSLRAPPSEAFLRLLRGAYGTPALQRVVGAVEAAGADPGRLEPAGWLAVSAALCAGLRCYQELLGGGHPLALYWPAALVRIRREPVLYARSLARERPLQGAAALCWELCALPGAREAGLEEACSPRRAGAIANALVPAFSRGLAGLLAVVDENCLGGLPAGSPLRPPRRAHRSTEVRQRREARREAAREARRAALGPGRRRSAFSRNPWVERELREEGGMYGEDSYEDLVGFVIPGDGE